MGFLADLFDFATFDLFDLNDSKKSPPPPAPDPSARGKAQLAEAKRLASLGGRGKGGTILTGGLGLDEDEDLVKKSTLLGG